METLYRKVAVSERKPNKSGSYYSDNDKVYYRQSTGRFEHDNDAHCVYPNWWLEEVPDNEDILRKENKQLLKSLKKVKRRWKNICNESDGTLKNTMVFEFGNGIEELLNKHKTI